MLAILPESNARRRRSPAGVAWSFLLHFGVATLATVATGMARDAVPSPPPTPDTVVWVSPASPIVPQGGGGRQTSGDAPADPTAPTMPAPIEVPVGIPPVDPSGPVIGIGPATEDHAVRSLLGTRRGVGGDHPGGAGGAHLAIPERVAIALPGNPRPRYPEVLRAAQIEGTVLVDCVVDTTGTIDPSSVRIIDSDHDHFTAAVRDVLPKLRFAPAETGGRRVRQWVRIPFEFRLSPRTQ